ncbi:sortase [Patescibacteria group bacterium]
MNDKISPIKFILSSVGCLFIFSLPVIAILAIWDFDLTKVKKSILSPFSNDDSNYNFEIPAGTDSLLTSTIINDSNSATITPRSNPATWLIIESASIEGNIVYGTNGEELLKQGFWHHPGSSYPGESGVSAIFGHRRYHLPPAMDTFYNLDKVSIGDRIELELEDGTWLEYSVTDLKVINPDQLNEEINEETDESIIKFFTCTPLGTALQRLVVVCERVV